MSATRGIELHVQCAWCGRTIKQGTPWPVRPIAGEQPPACSHGICKNCHAEELDAIRQLFHLHPRGSTAV